MANKKKNPLFSNKKQPKFLMGINWSNRLSLLVFVVLFAGIGGYFLFQSQAKQEDRVVPFEERPERGLVWAGLKSGKAGTLCDKLLEVVDERSNAAEVQGCTHGPDPAPEGLDATKSVEPLATGDGGQVAAAGSVQCDGDGSSGNRVQAIYARASDKVDRFDSFAASFQQYASTMNDVFLSSAQQTGGTRNVRLVTDANCNVIVSRAVVSPTGDDTIGNMATELRNQGYNLSSRKYLVWMDATVYCGIAYINNDDSAASTNANNRGPSFARVDSGCWGGRVEAHEVMHNLGGVQLSAPHTSGGYHCKDEYDRMCYSDGAGVTMSYVCPSTEESRFDCNKDDYYNTNPLAGSYLSSHWNPANSSFLIQGSGSTPPPPPPPTGDTTLPRVVITEPTEGSVIGNRVQISASSSDNVGVVKMEVYIDGGLRTTVSSSTISTNWNSRKASRGSHSITVKAYDAAGNVGLMTITVVK